MRTSARNMLKGRVESIAVGAVNSEVTLRLDNGVLIYSIITNESVTSLGLAPGRDATALIKSSWVILTAADEKIATSARNRLCGVVTKIDRGAVNAEVVMDLGYDTSFTAIITNESLDMLKLVVGSPACALVKASHVILAIEK